MLKRFYIIQIIGNKQNLIFNRWFKMNSIEINFLGVDAVAFYYTYLDDDDSHIDLDRLEINGQDLDVHSLAILKNGDLSKAKTIDNYICDLIEIELIKSAE